MAFLKVYGAVVLALLLPYACLEGSSLGCADGYTWEFFNESGEPVTITPFHVDESGTAHPLVAHGFERGRFQIGVAESRELHLELGDYDFGGIVVEFPGGFVRVLPAPSSHSPMDAMRIGSRNSGGYRPASPGVAVVHSAWSLAADRLRILAILVLLPPIPFAVAAGLLERRRSREERLDEQRASGLNQARG